MPDGEVVGLPANAQGMTVLPEIGQESQWAVPSHPMEILELCELHCIVSERKKPL